jgi:hypothetical protein
MPGELSPNAASPAMFAFCSVHGHQTGQIFALEREKTMLQFDGAIDGGRPRPTRCLVTLGQEGVSIRTLQGELLINGRVQRAGLLNVNDEIACGNARLRLIRQSGSNSLDHDEMCQAMAKVCPSATLADEAQPPAKFAPVQSPGDLHGADNLGVMTDENANRFFKSLSHSAPVGEPKVDGSTMCLEPGELRKLLEPTVYEPDPPEASETQTHGSTQAQQTCSGLEQLDDTSPRRGESPDLAVDAPAASTAEIAYWQADQSTNEFKPISLPPIQEASGVIVH